MNLFRRLVDRVGTVMRAAPLVTDTAFALLIGTAAMLSYLTTEPEGTEQAQDVVGAALIVAMAILLVFRRRRPVLTMVGTVPAALAFWVNDYPTTFDVFTVLTIYAAMAHGGPDRERVWRWTGVVVAAYTLVALVGVISPTEDLPPLALLGIVLVHTSAATIGELVHRRHEHERSLEERALRAENERELLARQAVLDERARIARELHDVVAHAMSVMVVQAGAAERLVESQPDRARQALSNIQSAGREALTDMRRMLGALRDADDPVALAPQPSLAEVEDVVRRCNESGIPTELVVTGDRPDGATGPELAGYRVVQEALTNVIKHAGRPAKAAVHITYLPGEVRVEVVDDGRGTTSDELAKATGHGLIGMRERVETFRGTLQAGPRPGGGFRVAATIPVTREPARSTA